MALTSYIMRVLKIRRSQFPHSPIDKHQLSVPYNSYRSLIDFSADSLKFDAALAGM